MILAWIRTGHGSHPHIALAADGRHTVRLPSATRRQAQAMLPALVRALAQANA